eukprot:Tbor_TRINITY_DN5553_c1_g2::TRINITY_DN5553_c1_g2_i2::g.13794::m.13794
MSDVKPVCFADDLTILTDDKTTEELQTKLNKALTIIDTWAGQHNMVVSSKTVYCIFKRPGSEFADLDLRVGDMAIRRETSPKLLGVYLDEHLTFTPHIDYLKDAITMQLTKLRVVANRSFGPKTADLRSFGMALVHGKMLYGATAWGSNLSKDGLGTLEKLQKQLACIVTGLPTNVTPQSALLEANLVPIKEKLLTLAARNIERYGREDCPAAYHSDPLFKDAKKRLQMAIGDRPRLPVRIKASYKPWDSLHDALNITPSALQRTTTDSAATNTTDPPKTVMEAYRDAIPKDTFLLIGTDGSATRRAATGAFVAYRKVEDEWTETHQEVVGAGAGGTTCSYMAECTAMHASLEYVLSTVKQEDSGTVRIHTDSQSLLLALERPTCPT